MGVMPEFPKSFTLDRKSNFASKLKSLIFHHLNLLCSDYSDDVLAEYITVLVCNGKNQNQAKQELEAFLGRRAQEFVCWLWKFLVKNETHITASISSDRKDKTFHSSSGIEGDKPKSSGTFKNHQSLGNSDSVYFVDEYGEIYCSSRQACKSDDIEPLKDHHPALAKEMANYPMQSIVPQSKVGTYDSSTKVRSSVRKHQAERVDRLKKKDFASTPKYALASVAKSSRCSKLSDKDPARIRRLSASLPGKTRKTHISNVSKQSGYPQMRYAGNALKRSISSMPEAPTSHINQPRQSVWDRLGKPRQDALRSQIAGFCVKDKEHSNKIWSDQNSPLIAKPAGRIGQIYSLPPLPRFQGCRRSGGGTNRINDIMRPKHFGKTDSEGPTTSNSGRKRQFGEISSHRDAGIPTRKRADNQSEKVCQSHKISEIPAEASQPIVPQVNDLKSRLQQLEIEMVTLQTKQKVMENDGKTNLLPNTGVIKPADDESRTVLVTNVHPEATKETLSMYFRKCGAVVDVKLADNMSSAQERSAYITFQNNEAADKALGFSGASFYSRTIKVCRKGEIPCTTTTSTQIVDKKIQITHSESNVDREGFSFPKSHFSWRNELPSAFSEPVSSTSDQTKPASESTCQQEPAASSAETAGELEQQNLATETCALQQELQTSI